MFSVYSFEVVAVCSSVVAMMIAGLCWFSVLITCSVGLASEWLRYMYPESLIGPAHKQVVTVAKYS